MWELRTVMAFQESENSYYYLYLKNCLYMVQSKDSRRKNIISAFEVSVQGGWTLNRAGRKLYCQNNTNLTEGNIKNKTNSSTREIIQDSEYCRCDRSGDFNTRRGEIYPNTVGRQLFHLVRPGTVDTYWNRNSEVPLLQNVHPFTFTCSFIKKL